MGKTIDTYEDVQSLGIETLRNLYQSAGLAIRPKTQVNRIEQLKEIRLSQDSFYEKAFITFITLILIMCRIGKILALFLIATAIISSLAVLTVKPVNAQSTPSPEITILYPTNGTFFNVSMGVDNFQLKYTTHSPLSWIGYSVDGGQNRTAYGAWFNVEQRSYDEDGNPSVRVSSVFESNGNHSLTLYANNTSGDWALPQTVTYRVDFNGDTYIPSTTSSPTIHSASLSPTATSMPTINNGSLVELPPIPLLVVVSAIIAVVIASSLLYIRQRKTANCK